MSSDCYNIRSFLGFFENVIMAIFSFRQMMQNSKNKNKKQKSEKMNG